jgi:hypothetical protein
MKRTLKNSAIAYMVGIIVAVIGIALWIFPMPWLFPFGQNVLAGIIIFVGVLTMIFGDPKGL